MTNKLTDTQLVLMRAAARREDCCLSPPEKLKGAAVAKLAAKLIEAGLAREIKAKAGMPIWRRDEKQRPFALKLAQIGLKAIAVNDESVTDASDERSTAEGSAVRQNETDNADLSPPEVRSRTPRAGSKLAIVIGLLHRRGGATIDDLIAATGWLPHTTRAAITGLRKRGYSVVLEKRDGLASSYRTAPAVPEAAEMGAPGVGSPTAKRRLAPNPVQQAA